MEDAPEVFMLTDNINSNEKRYEILENWYETSGVSDHRIHSLQGY